MSKERELITSAFSKAKSHENLGSTFHLQPFLPLNWPRRQTGRCYPLWLRHGIASLTRLVYFTRKITKISLRLNMAGKFTGTPSWKHQTEWFNWYGMWNWGDFQTDYMPAEGRWGYYNTKYSWRKRWHGYSLFHFLMVPALREKKILWPLQK